MKKLLLLLATFLSSYLSATAQTPLPYHSGFDSPSENEGWSIWQAGEPVEVTWSTTIHHHSAPYSVYHTYEGSNTEPITDWFVSPPFNFSSGASLRFQLAIYSFMGATADDSFKVYLLSGSNDPAAATVSLLADLTSRTESNSIFDSSGLITIPPTAGTSYIAFKYQSINNWFIVYLDDIDLKANTGTGIGAYANASGLNFYPVPAKNTLYWGGTFTAQERTARLFNMAGQELLNFDLGKHQLDISQLPAGMYFIEAKGAKYKVLKN